jgi:DNA-binding ferritin-like protein
MKHIHFHIKGEKFDTIHNLTESYYNQASWDADYLAELCMEKGQNTPNFSQAAQFIPSAIIATMPEYNYATAITDMSVYLGAYVSALQNFRNTIPDSDIQSKLDDMIRFWNKELNYKNKQRFE